MIQEKNQSRLAQAFDSGKPALLVEFVPAASDAETLRDTIAALPSGVDGVVVRSDSVSALACSALLASQRIDPVLALSTGDQNRNALLAEARGAALLGLRNILCLANGKPSAGASAEAGAAFDVDPTQLLQLITNGDGLLSTLVTGVEVYPLVRPLELSLIDTRKKAAAGAHFFVTQPIFDLNAFEEWLAAARQEGLIERVPLIAGVRALKDAEEAAKQQRRGHISEEAITRLKQASDPDAEGVALAGEIASRVVKTGGVRGLFVRASGKPEDISEVVSRSGIKSA
jgi:methylenetetrahydrofolate reductase (NADPH)